jgi:hypothetical protein
MHLAGLFIYPVKSLRGCAVTSAGIDALGLVGDRRFLVVDAEGRFLTQRTLPRMALIGTSLGDGHLVLTAAGCRDLIVRQASDASAPLRRVTIWKHEGIAAEDCGQEAADWLTRFLGVPCRLVRQGRDYERFVLKAAAHPDDAVSFADSCPFLLIGEPSLAALNDRLVARGDELVSMNRFRPNLVFSNGDPHAEDAWRSLRIGAISFRSAGPCARCIVVSTDQETGIRHPEPLQTLGAYRRDARDPSQVNFGVNLIHVTKAGTLTVGDLVVPDSPV